MATDQPQDKPSPFVLLRKLFSYLPFDWMSLALDMLQAMRHLLCRQPAGPYEILDCEVIVEIKDPKGSLAHYTKHQRVKFLQNNIIAFEDYAWGGGDSLEDYKCTPGVVVDRYKEGDRWNILISFRQSKSINDIEEFHIERVGRNAFTKTEGWLQTELRRPTRRLKMSVIFPKSRHCKSATIATRSNNQVTRLGPESFSVLPDDRQTVSWETSGVYTYELFTMKWRW